MPFEVYSVTAKTHLWQNLKCALERNRQGAVAADDRMMSPKGETGKVRENFPEEFARFFYYMIASLLCLAPKYVC